MKYHIAMAMAPNSSSMTLPTATPRIRNSRREHRLGGEPGLLTAGCAVGAVPRGPSGRFGPMARVADRARCLPRNLRVAVLLGQPRRRAVATRGDRGHPGADRPARPRGWRSTPAARTRAPTCSSEAFGDVQRVTGGDRLPGRRRARPRTHPDHGPATASGSGCCTTTPTPSRTRWPRCSRSPTSTRRSTSSAPSCASGPRCAGCSRSASRSPVPGAGRPAWSAASTTRASTTRCATCSRSTPPGCWSAGGCSRSWAASTTSSPMFGNDVDFGWRAAAAGHTTHGGARGGRVPRGGGPPRRSAVRR